MILIEANITPETLDSSSHEEEEKTIALENYLKYRMNHLVRSKVARTLWNEGWNSSSRGDCQDAARYDSKLCKRDSKCKGRYFGRMRSLELVHQPGTRGTSQSLYIWIVSNDGKWAVGRYRYVSVPCVVDSRMCVGPGAISREEFFNIVSAALRVDGNCSDVSVIDTA